MAIKILNTGIMNEHDKVNLFKELHILSSLDHPNIIKLKEAFEDQEKEVFYIIQELMSGGTLAETVQDYQYLCEENAARILKPIVDAIRFMHSKDFVHRDLKVDLYDFVA